MTQVDFEELRRRMLFLGLSDRQLRCVAEVLRVRVVAPGEVLVRRGELDDRLYLVERGAVELRLDEGDEPRVASTFERGSYGDEAFEGDVFGEFCLLDLAPWSGTLVARERTVLYELPREELYDLFEADIDLQIGLTLNIARLLTRRLRVANRRVADARARKEGRDGG